MVLTKHHHVQKQILSETCELRIVSGLSRYVDMRKRRRRFAESYTPNRVRASNKKVGNMVELTGIEPVASSLRTRRSPS
jgi:hypothetical protein